MITAVQRRVYCPGVDGSCIHRGPAHTLPYIYSAYPSVTPEQLHGQESTSFLTRQIAEQTLEKQNRTVTGTGES